MDMVIHFPDELGKRVREQPDANDFIVKAAQTALEKQILGKELAESATQGDRGEYADPEEIEAFFDRWNSDAG
ncbi:MAG: hypothetical protein HQL52_10110 [Magnetococcales bacterium]|nr:hypothetical protein [Magnetococcales bacterium]